MKVFVTGGTGLLGSRLVPRLAREGHTLLGLARSEASAEKVKGLGAAPVRGDLQGVEAWAAALEGVEVVVHAAAPVEFWGPWERFYEGITRATERLLAAASAAGVRRFIFISSESVMQDRAPLIGVGADHPPASEPNSFYGRSKKLAEEAILAFEGPIERVILRPTFIWGPGSGTAALLAEKARGGQFMWVDQGAHPFEAVHVDNVVEAIVKSLSAGKSGRAYLVTDDTPTTTRAFLGAMIEGEGVPVPKASMPGWLVRPLAGLVEALWRLLRLRAAPPLSRFEWAFVGMPRRYDISATREELGYAPVVAQAEGLKALRAPETGPGEAA